MEMKRPLNSFFASPRRDDPAVQNNSQILLLNKMTPRCTPGARDLSTQPLRCRVSSLKPIHPQEEVFKDLNHSVYESKEHDQTASYARKVLHVDKRVDVEITR